MHFKDLNDLLLLEYVYLFMTEWMLGLAGQHPEICGVIGWVDLKDPNVSITFVHVGELNHQIR